jgi:FkbM family methyltransferase
MVRGSVISLVRRLGFDVRRLHRVEELPNHLARILSSRPFELVVDVGAHVGQFGMLMRSLGYTGDILSFEPVSATFSRLSAAAAFDKQWVTQKVALGSEPGSMAINITARTTFSSFLPINSTGRSAFGEMVAIKDTETVDVKTLDRVLAELSYDGARNIFLKLDTQGYDQEVIEGSAKTLPVVTALLSEVSVRPIYDGMVHWTDAISAYERLGFEVTGLFPVIRDSAMRVVEFDCVMTRA